MQTINEIEIMTRMYETMKLKAEQAKESVENWNKYANGKIYAIKSYKTDKYYIGSTTKSLNERFSKHKSGFLQNNRYTTCHQILNYGNYYIELLEAFQCENRKQLRKREGEYIRQYLNNIVNDRIAGRTAKELYDVNREQNIKRASDYYHENKNEIKIAKNVSHICECGHTYSHSNKARHLKSIEHQNITNNIFVDKVKRTDIIHCECGSSIQHADISRHRRTQKHVHLMSN